MVNKPPMVQKPISSDSKCKVKYNFRIKSNLRIVMDRMYRYEPLVYNFFGCLC